MRLIIVIAALAMVACAHETTTMDRELALELARREPIVMAAAAPVINVNVGSNGQVSQEYETHVSSRNGCGVFPVYGANRVVIRYEEVCYGSGY